MDRALERIAILQQHLRFQSVAGESTTNVNSVLSPDAWKKIKLADKRQYNHNTIVFRFALPNADDLLGLPIGSHFWVRLNIEGKPIQRAYTPISTAETRGYFELLVKIYERGKISSALSKLSIGDEVEVKGPTGRFKYEVNAKRHLGMIAGGTGITPMYQVMQAIANNLDERTGVSLLCANVTESDILLHDELVNLCHQKPNFHFRHVLEKPSEDWKGYKGFVNPDHIAKHLPPPSDDVDILLCGPPGMMNAMRTHLLKLGHDEKRIFKF